MFWAVFTSGRVSLQWAGPIDGEGQRKGVWLGESKPPPRLLVRSGTLDDGGTSVENVRVCDVSRTCKHISRSVIIYDIYLIMLGEM